MTRNSSSDLKRLRGLLARQLVQPAALAALPMLSLAGFWVFGELALIGLAGILPLLYMAIFTGKTNTSDPVSRDALTGLISRELFEERVAMAHHAATAGDQSAALFTLEIDDFAELRDRCGQSAADAVVRCCADRISTVLRDRDTVARIGDGRFSGCVGPMRQLDLEICIQISGRLQTALEQPIVIDEMSVYVTVCVGFSRQLRAFGDSGAEWIEAAALALHEAQQNGPGSIRAFSDEMRRRTRHRAALRDDVGQALERGQIQPWFQPQVSTDTGKVTGFEALARWLHPEHGMISPADFLPAIEQAGLLGRLTELMLYHSFTALKAWDAADIEVPQVGVNFDGKELSDPLLLDKLQWELDRFGLEPNRLAVEVLETVMASNPEDIVARNLSGLNQLGCRIDLDDFGTGHASLAAIRRFSVSRIKIDRSFVLKSDRDPEQQKMIGAILTMAERLGVETLAEGVETVGEHAYLAQLGCDHVQGYGIAKPMPFDRTLDWLAQHEAKLEATPKFPGNRSAR